MKFLFVHEDLRGVLRSKSMLNALQNHGHVVEISDNINTLPTNDTDIYLYAMCSKTNNTIDLSHIKCRIIILQVDNEEFININRLSSTTLNNTYRFLRNNWNIEYPEQIKDRLGWMPTFIHPIEPYAGKDLKERSIYTMYYGNNTHRSRGILVDKILESKIPFDGGDFILQNLYFEKSKDTRILFAPWGHHPMTYRLYEGLAYRSLVIGQRIDMCTCINGHLTPGVHFVQVEDDLSDLIHTVRYYLSHIEEAQIIANAGYEHYCKYLAPTCGCCSEYVYQECFDSWDL